MADIRPFPGLHYNESLIKDWSTAICPPYDIISPQHLQELYLRSQYNFIRLEFGRELPQDTPADNRYTRSAATMEDWLKQGVLLTDPVPTFYLHDHYFRYQGGDCRRRSLVARVRLEQWDKMVIRPHEGTLTVARGDRLSLLWALQVNTSPILALFEDREQQICSLLADQEPGKPLISSKTVDGESHIVQAITDGEMINRISRSLAGQSLYIADGHHRYESALTYQLEKGTNAPSASEDEAFNFVMMELVDFGDPGLVVLAPHRLVRGIPKSILDGLMVKLEAFFEIEKLPLNLPDVGQQVDDLLGGTNEISIILFGPAKNYLFGLRLRDPDAAGQLMPSFHSELYKKLDVSIIDHIILEKLLELTSEKEETGLTYSYDITEAVGRVLDQEYQLALLFRQVKPEGIKAVADAGDKMPRKSTYFYPKAPSGLVINRLV
ncbi:MAG: hypothetical protein CL876_05855 [Dehalococcoidales bacterium]|nr:hypothetical protein [Dehalococcoidales bacterium]